MKLIPDKEIIKIPIKDNGEKLVNLKEAYPEIKIRLRPKGICYVRETVAKKLCKAQKSLLEGYHLVILDGYRPLKVQKKLYSDFYKKLKKKHHTWTKERLKQETDKFVAPIEIVPPHLTGGTVDLTIIGPNGRQLDMGTKSGASTKKSYTFSKDISKKARTNRKLLIKVMTKAGFVNYPIEWWHWSYGDRYWAAVKKKKYSIYKGI